jgi:hypothetical protein
MKTPLTEETLLSAYDNGGVIAVLNLCEPHNLPLEWCEPCEQDTPTWGKVCAVCWSCRE